MKKILFIVPHRLHRSPGQRFRFEQYLADLQKSGFEYEISPLLDEKEDRIFYSRGKYLGKFFIVVKGILKRLKDVRRANDFDIIFIYREAIMLGMTWFEKQFFKSAAKVIYDFDDAIWLLDVSEGNRNIAFLKKPEKTKTIFEYADLILAGNLYLKDFAAQFNKNVQIMPTTIDLNYHRKVNSAVKQNKICIGWTGTETTIKHFLSLLPVLEEIYEKYGNQIYFKLIADKEIEIQSIDLVTTRWSFDEEIEQLSEIDIGIMPLPDDQWANGKCGFKGLQYMALGIPTIMSTVGVNTEIIEDGQNGFLAATAKEWVEKLSRLIDSHELRDLLGEKGQETVRQNYSVQSNAPLFLNYVNSVLEQL